MFNIVLLCPLCFSDIHSFCVCLFRLYASFFITSWTYPPFLCLSPVVWNIIYYVYSIMHAGNLNISSPFILLVRSSVFYASFFLRETEHPNEMCSSIRYTNLLLCIAKHYSITFFLVKGYIAWGMWCKM